MRSRNAFEENMRLIKKHNLLVQNGTYAFELRSNVMADYVSVEIIFIQKEAKKLLR